MIGLREVCVSMKLSPVHRSTQRKAKEKLQESYIYEAAKGTFGELPEVGGTAWRIPGEPLGAGSNHLPLRNPVRTL